MARQMDNHIIASDVRLGQVLVRTFGIRQPERIAEEFQVQAVRFRKRLSESTSDVSRSARNQYSGFCGSDDYVPPEDGCSDMGSCLAASSRPV